MQWHWLWNCYGLKLCKRSALFDSVLLLQELHRDNDRSLLRVSYEDQQSAAAAAAAADDDDADDGIRSKTQHQQQQAAAEPKSFSEESYSSDFSSSSDEERPNSHEPQQKQQAHHQTQSDELTHSALEHQHKHRPGSLLLALLTKR